MDLFLTIFYMGVSINQSKVSGFQIAKLAYLSIRPTYYINYDYNEL